MVGREVKEIDVSSARMFACAAEDSLRMPRFIGPPWDVIKVNTPVSKHVLRLYGSETDGDVGMAYVKIFNDATVSIHVVLDYSLPERLLVENGELGIEIDYTFDSKPGTVGVGREYARKSKIEIDNIIATRASLFGLGATTPVDGYNGIRRLKPVAWTWDF